MSGFNQAVLLGRLTAPPEELTTRTGKMFVKAVIATSVHQRGNDGASEEKTSFVPVTIFGRTAEIFLKYVQKGDMVHLVGRLDSNEWKTDAGEKRLSLSFVVEQLNLLPNERSKPQSNPARPQPHSTERLAESKPNPTPSSSSKGNSRPVNYNADGEPDQIPF
jgi:single-strand DNA-binding protein